MKKNYAICNTKQVQKSSWNEPYSSSSYFTKQSDYYYYYYYYYRRLPSRRWGTNCVLDGTKAVYETCAHPCNQWVGVFHVKLHANLALPRVFFLPPLVSSNLPAPLWGNFGWRKGQSAFQSHTHGNGRTSEMRCSRKISEQSRNVLWKLYIGWRWRNFVRYLCQLVFAAILWVNLINICYSAFT